MIYESDFIKIVVAFGTIGKSLINPQQVKYNSDKMIAINK